MRYMYVCIQTVQDIYKSFFSTVYRNLGTNGIQLEAAINILYDSVIHKYIFDHNYPEFSSQVRGIHGV